MKILTIFMLIGVIMASCSINNKSSGILVYAKNIDYTPDVTSDKYWDTHHICIVRITDITLDDAGKKWITFEVIKQISEGPMDLTKTLPLSHLWFGDPLEEKPALAKNDNLVIYYTKEGPSSIVTTKLDMPPDDSPLVKRLLRIAGLRANEGDFKSLSEGVFDTDIVIALYCLNRMYKISRIDVEADYISRLRKLQDNEETEPQLRLSAFKLAEKLEGKERNLTDEEYVWLKASIMRSTQHDWTKVRPFVDRLLEFEDKRNQTIDFLVQLVSDRNKTQSIRIAAYGSFDDARLFHFQQPDPESESIFIACIKMLKDPDLLMRNAGAALLYNICAEVAIPFRHLYIERTSNALSAAIRIEKDDVSRDRMKHYLEMINKNLSGE